MCSRSFIILLLVTSGGCVGTSRWAMDDKDYAQKYSAPYEEHNKIPRMAKQMLDARHVRNKLGFHVAGGASDSPTNVMAEIGGTMFLDSWLEGRLSLTGLVGPEHHDNFMGINAGLRAHIPARVTPFVGVGVFAGGNEHEIDATNDGINNDGDLFIDEPGETKDVTRSHAAVYPEIGAHFWLSGQVRLTASAARYFSTEGRDSDFWLLGAGITLIPTYGEGDVD